MRLRKIKFKKFKGYFYIEPYNEKYDRCDIYDQTKHYLGYIDTNFLTKSEYNKIVNEYKNCIDEFDFFECFNCRYDYNITPQAIMLTYCDDILCGWGNEWASQEVEEITNDIKVMSDIELCNEYDINKIGKYYFRGEW